MFKNSSLEGRHSLVASTFEEGAENQAPHKSNTKYFLLFVASGILICLMIDYTTKKVDSKWGWAPYLGSIFLATSRISSENGGVLV